MQNLNINNELIMYIDKYQNNINKMYIDKFWSNINNKDWIYVDDQLIEWIGYMKSNGKFKYNHLIKENFKENIDYKIYNYEKLNNIFHSPLGENENNKEILAYKGKLKNIHNRTTHLILSPKCFKKSLMMIRTEKANQIRDYYVYIEELCLEFNKYLLENKNKELARTQEKLENKNAELAKNKQNTIIITENMILSYNGKSVVYVAIIGKNKIKFGITNKIIERVKQHKKNFERFEIVYISICLNNLEIESLLKDYAKENNKLRNQVINDNNYTELIDINENFTIEMVINKINENCQIQYDYRTLLDKYNTLQGYNEELQDQIKQLEITNIHQISKLKNENEYLKNKNIDNTTNQQSTDKTEKRYKCTKCNIFTCNKKRDLIEHENRVNKCDEVRKVKTYNCYKCNKEFKKPSTLEEHLNRKSSCDIVLKCDKCNKIFTLLYNYNQHINRLKSCV